jgi:RNA polymerase sigma factor (sigma-70 family)
LSRGNKETLAELIKRICNHHDDDAAVPFYEHCRPLVYGYIFKKFSSMQQSDVDDAFQGFFEKLMGNGWRRLCAWRQDSAASTYLLQILKNYLSDQYRKNRPMDDESAIEDLGEDPRDDLENSLHMDQLRPAIRGAMETLSDRDREIIQRMFSDESANQIADAFGMSKATYYKACYDAKKRLKAQMMEEFPEFFEK